MVDRILALPERHPANKCWPPVVRGKKGTHASWISGLVPEGFRRCGSMARVREASPTKHRVDKNHAHTHRGRP